MHAHQTLPDLLLMALSQALRAKRLDVADHILSAIEELTDEDGACDELADAYRMIAANH